MIVEAEFGLPQWEPTVPETAVYVDENVLSQSSTRTPDDAESRAVVRVRPGCRCRLIAKSSGRGR